MVIVLYGGPTTGKDSITSQLESVDRRFVLYKKIKVGTGRSTGYVMSAARPSGADIVSEVRRYENSYFVTWSTITNHLARHEVPVIHTSSMSEVELLRTALPRRIGIQPYVALLTNSYSDFRCRSSARGDVDQEARSAVWLRSRRDALQVGPIFDTAVDTSRQSARRSASEIINRLRQPRKQTRIDLSDWICPVAVPVPTPRRPTGEIDFELTARLAQRIASADLDVLLNGTTGRGSEVHIDDVVRLYECYIECIDPSRIILSVWGIENAKRLTAQTGHPPHRTLVGALEQLPDPQDFLNQLAAADEYLAHLDPVRGVKYRPGAVRFPAALHGVKIAKATPHALTAAATELGGRPIYDGSGRDIEGSLSHGAACACAVGLNFHLPPSGSSLSEIQQLERQGRELRVGRDRAERLANLETWALRSLSG